VSRTTPRSLVRPALFGLAIGVVNGLVFLGFEWLVNHGTDWLWNDVVDTDEVRCG